MKAFRYIRIVVFLGIISLICSAAGAAGMGIVAETHETSGVSAPVCSAPCECMSLTQAMQRWGTDGYDYCSKTVCGQSADAMVQYYCLHQTGSPAVQPVQTQAPAAAGPAAAGAATQKSPAGLAPILAAMSLALVVAGSRRG